MTLTFSARRTDQQLQIGSRHGYRIEGDQACINAELSVPPYHPGGSWALELWASERPYQGGELSGVRVSEVRLELPTPLAPHTHRVEANVPARLPLQGRSYFMQLALVELNGAERRVRDVTSYPAQESFPGPQLQGDVGYEIRGHEVLLQAAAVSNPRAPGNLSGTLSLELWAYPLDVADAAEPGQGSCLAAAQLQPVAGGGQLSGLCCRAPFSEPPPGSYGLSLLLREWTHAYGYLTRDRRDFTLSYRVAPQEAAAPEEVAPMEAALDEAALDEAALDEAALNEAEPAEAAAEIAGAQPALAQPVAAAPVEAAPVEAAPEAVEPRAASAAFPEEPEAELDWEVPEPVAPPPASVAVPRGSRAVSINLASVDELARVKGLNKKLAKEIVEKRPFASIEQLIEVRGIGRKTLDKLRSLVTL